MTRLVRFANNATSKLAASLSSVGLTISLTPGDGAKFPTLAAGQFFKGTLIKADGTKEVVKVTARSSDTLTVSRADEAVGGVQTAYAFSAGDKFELRLTADALAAELDRLDAAAFLEAVTKNANYSIVETDVSKLIKTDTSGGNIVHTLPQISTLTGSFEVQINKNTGDSNTVTVNRAGTDTINGLTSYVLGAQYQCVWLVADLATGTWSAITSASAVNQVVDVFAGAGTPGPFTLSGAPGSKNNTIVHVGGVYQNKATYTLIGTQLTLGGNVGAGVPVECAWAQPVAIGTPSDATVSRAKLADDVKRATQSQTDTAFPTTGTSTAYVLTPTTPVLAYGEYLSFFVKFNVASGANPTLQISGLSTPPNLVERVADGTYVNIGPGRIPVGHCSRVTLLGTTQALVEDLPDLLDTTRIDVASASTVNLTTAAPSTRNINFTGTTPITGFIVAPGLTYFARFNASLPLVNGAGLVTQTGANIVTQNGDTCTLRATAANTVEVLSYVSATTNRKFVSTDQAVTGNAVLNVAHGLGSKPSFVRVVLKCTTADLGYSVGDEIEINSNTWASSAILNVASDTTNVAIIVGGANIVVVHKGTFAASNITNASWRWVVRAWA